MECVHGGKGKGKRDEAIKGFREGRVWVLVVTEVLARGMDFRGVKVVVNFGKWREVGDKGRPRGGKSRARAGGQVYSEVRESPPLRI